MKTEFIRDTYHSYMVIEPEKGKDKSFEEQMLIHQESPYLLHFHPQETDGTRRYCYEITGMMDFVSCVNRRPARLETMRHILESLLGALDALNEYLLEPDCLVFIPDRIYMDLDEGNLHFAYIPGCPSDFLKGLQGFGECLLNAADHGDRECVMLVYAFYRLVREGDFSAAQVRRLLQEEKEPLPKRTGTQQREEKVSMSRPEPERTEYEDNGPPKRVSAVPVYCAGALICLAAALAWRQGWLERPAAALGIGEKYLLAGILFAAGAVLFILMRCIRPEGETGYGEEEADYGDPEDEFWKESDYPGGHYEFLDYSEEDGDRTVILSAGRGVRFVSMNKNVAQDVMIGAFPSIIGAKAPEAQALISCCGISRRHAMLEEAEGRYYLSDLGSTNGTWVNGERLRPDEKYVLAVEDELRFADIRFIFLTGSGGGDGR